MGAIAAVVFDYGGVLSQPPYDGIVRHEAELGLPAGTLRDFFREGHDVYDEFLCGRMSGREFMKAVGTHVQDSTTCASTSRRSRPRSPTTSNRAWSSCCATCTAV